MLEQLKTNFPQLDQEGLIRLQNIFRYRDYGITVVLKERHLGLVANVLRHPNSYSISHSWMTDSTPVTNKLYNLDREFYRQVYHCIHGGDAKCRHENRLRLYFKDLQKAMDFIKMAEKYDQIHEITAVSSCHVHGEVVVRQKTLGEYRYKITLNPFDTTEDPQNVIGQTFDNFADTVRLTGSIRRLIDRDRKVKYPYFGSHWFWGGYFYAKDDAIATYLSLSWPNLIKKIHRVKYVSK